MKKTDFRTKRKQQQEANTSEAEELIQDFLTKRYIRNDKTEKILEEYIEEKDVSPKT